MTLTEALAELGLKAGADADTVRRTYLRLIKERKPEADPEGFRRAREAFEIVRGAGELAFFAAESERRHSAPTPSAAERPSAADALDSDVASPRVEPDLFAAFLHEWRAVPASAGILPRVGIARRAIAALPQDPRPYWLMVNTRSELGTDAEIADALRAGHRGGWIEFLEALLARVPRLATVAEIEEALRGPSTTLQLLGAAALAPRDPARATSVVVDFVRAARGEPTGDIPISRLVSVILALHESDAPVYAAAAQSAVTELMRDQGLELALLKGPLGGVWAMASELAALPLEFPPALRRSFAASTRAGDLQSAFYDACFHTRHHRREVVAWGRRTEGVAPNVSATLKAALLRERRGDQQRARSRWWIWFAMPGVIAVLRFCASSSGPSIYTHVDGRPAPQFQSPTLASPRAPSSMPILTEAAIALCGDDWSGTGRLPCQHVQAAVEALQSGDCRRARSSIRTIKQAMQDTAPTEGETRVLTGCDLVWWQTCRLPDRAPSENTP